jgi:hypothetical protein
MVRAMIIAAIAAFAPLGATAQTSFPGVAPPVPSPATTPPPPAIAPGPAAPQAHGPSARTVLVPGQPPVHIPAGPRGRNSYSDRVERCVHYGTAAGVSNDQIGAFTAQCAR